MPITPFSETVRAQLGASIFPAGNTIFPKIGGAIATNKKRLTTQNSCVDNNVMGAIPRRDKVRSDFLFYFFCLAIFQSLPTKRIFRRSKKPWSKAGQ